MVCHCTKPDEQEVIKTVKNVIKRVKSASPSITRRNLRPNVKSRSSSVSGSVKQQDRQKLTNDSIIDDYDELEEDSNMEDDEKEKKIKTVTSGNKDVLEEMKSKPKIVHKNAKDQRRSGRVSERDRSDSDGNTDGRTRKVLVRKNSHHTIQAEAQQERRR